MATTYGCKVNLKITPGITYTATMDLSSATDSFTEALTLALTAGTSSGQADTFYHVQLSLDEAGGVAPTHELNLLAAGALEDAFGRTVDMDELKAIVIRNNIAGNLEVGGSAANSIGLFADDTDKLVLPTTAIIAVGLGATGIDVTTDSKLKFENKHTAAGTVDVLLVGAS